MWCCPGCVLPASTTLCAVSPCTHPVVVCPRGFFTIHQGNRRGAVARATHLRAVEVWRTNRRFVAQRRNNRRSVVTRVTSRRLVVILEKWGGVAVRGQRLRLVLGGAARW